MDISQVIERLEQATDQAYKVLDQALTTKNPDDFNKVRRLYGKIEKELCRTWDGTLLPNQIEGDILTRESLEKSMSSRYQVHLGWGILKGYECLQQNIPIGTDQLKWRDLRKEVLKRANSENEFDRANLMPRIYDLGFRLAYLDNVGMIKATIEEFKQLRK